MLLLPEGEVCDTWELKKKKVNALWEIWERWIEKDFQRVCTTKDKRKLTG
jgi:hypothetical protein